MDSRQDQQREWNDRYYKRHGEDVKASRRAKYKADPKYREGVLAKQREKYRVKRGVVVPGMRHPIKMVVRIHGKSEEVLLFSIQVLSVSVRRSVQTIRLWEKEGVIPKTPFRINSHRAYTEKMIEAVQKVLDGGAKSASSDTKEKITDAWRKLGIAAN